MITRASLDEGDTLGGEKKEGGAQRIDQRRAGDDLLSARLEPASGAREAPAGRGLPGDGEDQPRAAGPRCLDAAERRDRVLDGPLRRRMRDEGVRQPAVARAARA